MLVRTPPIDPQELQECREGRACYPLLQAKPCPALLLEVVPAQAEYKGHPVGVKCLSVWFLMEIAYEATVSGLLS